MPKQRPAKLGLHPREVDSLGSAFQLDTDAVHESVRAISAWKQSEEELRAWLCRRYRWNAQEAANHLSALCVAVLRASRGPELILSCESQQPK
jgi:hypothetical protein